MFLKDYKKGALIFDGIKIAYSELLEMVEKYSQCVDIEIGDRVAIYSENCPQWIYSFFSIWKKGGISVLIDYLAVESEVEYIIDDCSPKYIFVSKSNYKKVENLLKNKDINVIILDDLTEENYKYDKGEYEKQPEDSSVIIYTSGTTGSPKGVVLTYDNLMSQAECFSKKDIVGKDEKVLSLLPYHHAYPLTATLITPLYMGAEIVILNNLTSSEILNALNKYKIEIVIGVPRLFELLHKGIMGKIEANFATKLLMDLVRKTNSKDLGRIIFKKVYEKFGGNIKLMISGGSALDKTIYNDFQLLGFNISEGYGLSETAPIISFSDRNNVRVGKAGQVLEICEVKTQNGEILIRGRNLMKGYYNKEKETNEVIIDGWFHTGDLGFVDSDGYLEITGRKKDIIVLANGKNINPTEIEQKLLSLSSLIKEVGVLEDNHKLIALICPDLEYAREKGIANIDEAIKWDIIEQYNLQAPSYKKLNKFKLINSELPKTRLGKIKRYKLKSYIVDEEVQKQHLEEPDWEEYDIVKDYLEKVSGREVYPEYHIEMDLGFDSLEKVELQYFIEKTFGFKFSMERLIKTLVVKDLAEYIREKRTKIESEDIDWKNILSQDIDYEISENSWLAKFGKMFFTPLFSIYLDADIKGTDKLPETPFIIAPNHQSYMDGVLLNHALPNNYSEKTCYLAKEEHFTSGLNKYIADNSNIVVIDINKNMKEALQKIAKVVKLGYNLVIFPEGTRTRTGKVNRFKKTFAIIAKETNVPIVPTVIKGAYESLPRGRKFPKSQQVTVKFLNPIYPEGKSYDEITELTHNEIEKELYR